jgi:disulfide bond formation protein DsbB
MNLADHLPSHRIVNLAGVILAITAMLVAVVGLQYGLGLEPCPLCMIDRVLVVSLGVLFLAAALHNPGLPGQRVYAMLNLVVAGTGVAVCARHIWLQGLPPDAVPECAPGLDYMLEVLPLFETLRIILSTSGECAKIDWTFLGITLPQWTLVLFLGFAVLAVLQFLGGTRRAGHRPPASSRPG